MINLLSKVKIFIFLLVFFVLVDFAYAEKQKKLLLFITIDVEAGSYMGRPNKLSDRIYGYINGEYWGIPKIMELCKKYNIGATFFIDVYEYKYYGEDAFKKIVTQIKENGFDVQLHAHPHWYYGNNKDKMWQYSLEQQIEIIREGKQLIRDWTGVDPVAFRAGSYAADRNTLRALEINDIPLDSSLAYGNPTSKLGSLVPPFSINKPSKIGNVMEIPVTGFKEFQIGKYKRIRRFDIEANTMRELRYVVEKAKIHRLPVLVLMVHSHSFVKWNVERTKHWGDPSELRRFEEFLKYISSDESVVPITFSEFYNLIQEGYKLDGTDYVPSTGFFMTYLRSWERIDEGGKNVLFAFIPFIILVFSTLFIFLYISRSKKKSKVLSN